MRLAAVLAAILLLAGCAPAPPRQEASVVGLGDSVPAGTACGCTPFPDLFARMLVPPAAVADLARPGVTSAMVLAGLRDGPDEPPARRATVVLIMVGANDMADAFGDGSSAGPADKVRENVAAIVRTVRALHPAASVLVFGYWNVVRDGAAAQGAYTADQVARAAALTDACNEALRQAAADTGAVFVDTRRLFKGADGSGDPTALLAADGDHPNAAGHELIAQAAFAVRPGA
ncbi:SGNH/GDSL hydrolase family protein [Actinoplanes sp. NBRC 103695]|uniref:SGNH/GDSL hydrolase family protein n=1 Tax=Actinoplanes sp. NBRC 103695 TaxID=3032202 RepID=UPI002557C6E8|nr:SGNH/GDSL hydrolase family protein [Actinoplanes sp. NBRC 103695]